MQQEKWLEDWKGGGFWSQVKNFILRALGSHGKVLMTFPCLPVAFVWKRNKLFTSMDPLIFRYRCAAQASIVPFQTETRGQLSRNHA